MAKITNTGAAPKPAPGLISIDELTDQQIARLDQAMTCRRGIHMLEEWINTLDKMHSDRRARLTRQLQDERRRLGAELDILSRAFTAGIKA